MSKRMNIVIDGSFHGKSITLRPDVIVSSDGARVTAWFSALQIKKARRELCGCEGCQCGDGVIDGSMPVRVIDGCTVST